MKLVGFDANGTALNDLKGFLEALTGIFRHFDKEPLPPDELRDRFSMPWTRIYREAGISEDVADDDVLYEIYSRFYGEQPDPMLADGFVEVLEALRERGILTAIVSTQRNDITVPLMQTHGIEHLLDNIVGGVHDKAEALRQLAESFGVESGEAMYVGDQDSDMRFAKAAGWVPVGFTGGIHDAAKLKDAGAVHMVDHFRELLRLL